MYLWLLIVPIIAKALSKLEDVVNITVFGHSFDLELALPFSWKIFYFSALSFALANVVFIWKSYSLIKEHRSYTDFRDQGKWNKQIVDYANEIDLSKSQVEILAEQQINEESSMVGDHDERMLRVSFWLVFEKTDCERPYWRLTCGLLYVGGFTLLSIIIVQNLGEVMRLSF